MFRPVCGVSHDPPQHEVPHADGKCGRPNPRANSPHRRVRERTYHRPRAQTRNPDDVRYEMSARETYRTGLLQHVAELFHTADFRHF